MCLEWACLDNPVPSPSFEAHNLNGICKVPFAMQCNIGTCSRDWGSPGWGSFCLPQLPKLLSCSRTNSPTVCPQHSTQVCSDFPAHSEQSHIFTGPLEPYPVRLPIAFLSRLPYSPSCYARTPSTPPGQAFAFALPWPQVLFPSMSAWLIISPKSMPRFYLLSEALPDPLFKIATSKLYRLHYSLSKLQPQL